MSRSLAEQGTAKAKEAVRIEAGLAKCRAARERDAQRRQREQERAEREREQAEHEALEQQLEEGAERRSHEVAAVLASRRRCCATGLTCRRWTRSHSSAWCASCSPPWATRPGAPGTPATTASTPSPCWETAHRNGQRLDLIDGRNLKALLLEHLGIDALTGLPKIPPGRQPSDVD
ncbi:hypothetical protein [Kitasatospora phosalacinea]|uniref:hypothetical protein n=1 Tax=Kitasatospora phosalacinea TaxID=2065 RepID=UPI003CC91A2A